MRPGLRPGLSDRPRRPQTVKPRRRSGHPIGSLDSPGGVAKTRGLDGTIQTYHKWNHETCRLDRKTRLTAFIAER